MKKQTAVILLVVIAIVAFIGGMYYGKASAPARRREPCRHRRNIHAHGLRHQSVRRRRRRRGNRCGADYRGEQPELHAPARERQFGGGILFAFDADHHDADDGWHPEQPHCGYGGHRVKQHGEFRRQHHSGGGPDKVRKYGWRRVPKERNQPITQLNRDFMADRSG